MGLVFLSLEEVFDPMWWLFVVKYRSRTYCCLNGEKFH